MYRQQLGEQRALFSRVQPVVPKIVGQSGLVNGVWVVGESLGNTVLSLGRRMTALEPTTRVPFTEAADSGFMPQIATLLSPYPPSVRATVQGQLRDWFEQVDQSVVLAGQVSEPSHQFVVVPGQTTLLGMAIFGLAVYLLFSRLHGMSFITVLVLITVGLYSVTAIAPGPAWAVLSKLFPGGVLALVAAVLQRLLSGPISSKPMKHEGTDETTIFTFDQLPDPTSASAGEIPSTAMTS